MRPLPPPPPQLWAPRARRYLMRFLAHMDRRAARRLAAGNQDAIDMAWYRLYVEWWTNHGWAHGAETPEEAWRKARARR